MRKIALYTGIVVIAAATCAWAAYQGGWQSTDVPGVGAVQACACKELAGTSSGGTKYYTVNFAAKTPGYASGWLVGVSGQTGRRGKFGTVKLEENKDAEYAGEATAYGTDNTSLTGSVKIRLRMWNPSGGGPVNLLPPMPVKDLPDCDGDEGKPCPPPKSTN